MFEVCACHASRFAGHQHKSPIARLIGILAFHQQGFSALQEAVLDRHVTRGGTSRYRPIVPASIVTMFFHKRILLFQSALDFVEDGRDFPEGLTNRCEVLPVNRPQPCWGVLLCLAVEAGPGP